MLSSYRKVTSESSNKSIGVSWLMLLLIVNTAHVSTAFRYQEDTAPDCPDKIDECTSSDTVWFTCPVTCNKDLQKEGSMFEIHDDPQKLFLDMSVTKHNGKRLDLEDFEGYVTLYATIPLIPGMAPFYYELLEHVQSIYPYTVQTLIEPFTPPEGIAKSTIIQHNKPKTIVLQETSRPTQVLDYLLKAPQVAGNPDIEFHTDRVTIWLLSADGMFFERLTSPPMTLLERRLAVFLKQLAYTPDL